MLLTHGDSKIKGKLEDFKILAKMSSTFGELWVQFLFSVEGILPGVVIDGGVLSRHHRKALWVYVFLALSIRAYSICYHGNMM